MTVKTIEDLFIHELSDIYSAEKQLTKALPRLARASSSPDLAAAFESHLEETQGQVERIDQIVDILGIKLKRMKCAAMEGLVEEGKEVIEEIEKGPLRDVALIGGGNKVEHYEIASYGTLAALAKQLGYTEAVPLLLETLEEEKAADEKLTLLGDNLAIRRRRNKRREAPAAPQRCCSTAPAMRGFFYQPDDRAVLPRRINHARQNNAAPRKFPERAMLV